MAVGGGATAQDSARSPAPVFVGSEAETYLRYLQLLGDVPLHQWSVRGFTDIELSVLMRSDRSSPRPALRRPSTRTGIATLPMHATMLYNSRFPYGFNDGARWAGRGLVAEVRGGITAKWGPLRVNFAPTAFWSENRSFPLMPVADSLSPFADGLYPDQVDRPQRFGASAYARLDPGQSGVRVEGLGAVAGFSWENRWWGPMASFPYILGNNAAGFPHLFLGSASPRAVGVGRISATVLYGQLQQTPYSSVQTGDGRRFASGMVFAFEPRWFPGLEVGFARFFHVQWPDSGLVSGHFTHLFEGLLKSRLGRVLNPVGPAAELSSADNQLGSVFARWVLPRSGAEVYAEFGREDHNWNTRDLIVEPDHTAAIGLGVQKAWRRAHGLRAVRFESLNHQVSTLQRHRGQGGAYRHTFTRQGHTQRGELLGAATAVGGGAAASVAYESWTEGRHQELSWSRFVVLDPDFGGQSVRQVLSVRRTVPHSAGILTLGIAVAVDLNRNLGNSDVSNLRFEAGWTHFK